MRHADKKTEFNTGAKRDSSEGKGSPSLISPLMIHRLGVHLQKGADHYGADNWMAGMPYRRTADSIIRHIFQWLACDNEEDHLSAVIFGAMVLMTYEEDPDPLRKANLDDRDERLKKTLSRFLTSVGSKPIVDNETTASGNEDGDGEAEFKALIEKCSEIHAAPHDAGQASWYRDAFGKVKHGKMRKAKK